MRSLDQDCFANKSLKFLELKNATAVQESFPKLGRLLNKQGLILETEHGSFGMDGASVCICNQSIKFIVIREAWLPSCPSPRLMFKTQDYIV